eukprot:m.194706 g.194706  ORF g.194706 m.194706 type:complete len:480 (-) comp10621_c2_seq2:91-1530(-)
MEKSVCCICGDGQSQDDNQFVVCKQCDIKVHQKCYGVPEIPNHRWFCKRCEPHSLVRAAKKRCDFCPESKGAVKPTDRKDVWSHVVCARFLPGLELDENQDIHVTGTPPRGMTCHFCSSKARPEANSGATVRCTVCNKHYHVTCAIASKLVKLPLEAGSNLSVSCSTHRRSSVTSTSTGAAASSVKANQASTTSRTASSSSTSDARAVPEDPKCADCGKVFSTIPALKSHISHFRCPVRKAAAEKGGSSSKASSTRPVAAVAAPAATAKSTAAGSRKATLGSEALQVPSPAGGSAGEPSKRRRIVGSPLPSRAAHSPSHAANQPVLGGILPLPFPNEDTAVLERTFAQRLQGVQNEEEALASLQQQTAILVQSTQELEHSLQALLARKKQLLKEIDDRHKEIPAIISDEQGLQALHVGDSARLLLGAIRPDLAALHSIELPAVLERLCAAVERSQDAPQERRVQILRNALDDVPLQMRA